MKNAPVLHRLEYVLFEGLRATLRALPHPASRRIGRLLGVLAWWLLGGRRKVTLNNLQLAFPQRSRRDIRRMGRESFQHLGSMTCDTISSYRFDAVGLCQQMSIEGWEHLEAARREGRGVLVMSAHLGTWEMAAYPVGLYAETMHVIGRPLDNPLLDRRLGDLRTRFGNATIPKRGAARGSMRVLRDAGIVGILIDQRVRPEEGLEVPFFGQLAITTPLLAKLVLKTGAPVVPLFGHLEPGGRYRIACHPALDLDLGLEGEQAVEAITAECLRFVEEQIRSDPTTWLWLHRRWRK